MRRSRVFRPVVLLMALNVSACSTWQVAEIGPRQVIEAQPSRVRVTQLDGARTVLSNPSIDGDSIRGLDGPSGATRPGARPAAPGVPTALSGAREGVPTTVAIVDVGQMEVSRINPPRTLLFAIGVVVVVRVMVALTDCYAFCGDLSGFEW